MGTFLYKSGCNDSPSYSHGLCSCGNTVKYILQSGANLPYNGPNLPGTGVRTCDNLNVALQKMDAIILQLRQEIADLKAQQ